MKRFNVSKKYMNEKISIIETEKYIYISIEFSTNKSIGWNKLHALKNDLYPNLVFIEVHPVKGNLVDNANVRHLYHLKNIEVPDLRDLSLVENYKVIRTD